MLHELTNESPIMSHRRGGCIYKCVYALTSHICSYNYLKRPYVLCINDVKEQLGPLLPISHCGNMVVHVCWGCLHSHALNSLLHALRKGPNSVMSI